MQVWQTLNSEWETGTCGQSQGQARSKRCFAVKNKPHIIYVWYIYFLLTDYIDSFPYSLARKMLVLPNGSEKMNIHNVGSLQWQREHKSLKLGGKPIIRSARISARWSGDVCLSHISSVFRGSLKLKLKSNLHYFDRFLMLEKGGGRRVCPLSFRGSSGAYLSGGVWVLLPPPLFAYNFP